MSDAIGCTPCWELRLEGRHLGGLLPVAACRYIKFDTYHPAVDKGLPVTRVISRITLQVRSTQHAAAAASGS